MESRDLIITPIVVFLTFVVAYMVRNSVTDAVTRKYYFPALALKIFGAIMVGVIYQFYYSGGDTFAYHTHGSRVIWEEFMNSPMKGLELLFSHGEMEGSNWNISDRIWFYRDQKSFFIVRISTIFDLVTFSTYSATAVFFAIISFCGGWMLFSLFYKKYPRIHGWLAFSCLFIPSIIFWGSGILKDTVTLSFLCIATWCVNRLFIEGKFSIRISFLLILSLFVIFSVKVYILMSFLAAALVWVFAKYYFRITNLVIRVMVIPFIFALVGILGFFGINEIVKEDPRYAFENLAQTVQTTAYDIRFWSGKNAGSGYTLGELDGSIGSVVKLAPAAINVSMFRPYIWEVNNPLMLLSALESMLNLVCTLYILLKVRKKIFRYVQIPEVFFCLTFSVIFAFSVGVSSYNFGTLARYKIPFMPYYFVALGIIYHVWKSERKLPVLAETE